jgi:DNA-binding transcriptional regulator LsrR (DeoR family)
MAKVADLYYLRDLPQRTIAERLGLSRPAVSRLLTRSRAAGVVRIEVIPPEGTHHTLEHALEATFGLREAVVVGGRSESPVATRRALGRAGAAYLDRLLRGGERIGISWGGTLGAVIDHVRPRALKTTIIPLVGGLGQAAPGIHANDLARRLGEAHRGRVHLLHAPAVVATPGVRDALLSDPRIHDVLDLARGVSVALVGIGALGPSSTLIESGCVSAAEIRSLRRRGAVGDVCTRPFGPDGSPSTEALDARILALTLNDLRRIPTVIGIAGGIEKAEAILGVLRGGLVDVLVTDQGAARAVLRLAQEADGSVGSVANKGAAPARPRTVSSAIRVGGGETAGR